METEPRREGGGTADAFPGSVLQQLLGDVPRLEFIRRCFGRLPVEGRGTAAPFRSLITWEHLGRVLGKPEADVIVARSGEEAPLPRPSSLEEAQAVLASGATIAIRHVERQDPEIAALGAAFVREIRGRLDVHLYATPPLAHGFGWHYDAEDVFILQAEGSKRFLLRKNTVNPYPVASPLPHDLRFEREVTPTYAVTLGPGDWLYVPSGWWHAARSRDALSLSLAIGLMTRTALDLIEHLREELLASVLWRQRLPVVGDAAGRTPDESREELAGLIAVLARDLARVLGSRGFVERYFEGLDEGPEARG